MRVTHVVNEDAHTSLPEPSRLFTNFVCSLFTPQFILGLFDEVTILLSSKRGWVLLLLLLRLELPQSGRHGGC